MPTLEITTMVGCPLRCTFCPQDSLRSAYGGEKYMSVETFEAILARVPPHVRIDFSGMSEPWANPKATGMLQTAIHARRTLAVYTTLYGMDAVSAAYVVGAALNFPEQFEVVCVHLPDANGNMRGWKHSPEYEANLRLFMTLKGVLPRFEVMTMDGTGRVNPDLGHLGIECGAWIGHTRAGNVSAPAGQAITEKPRHETPVMCSFTPFYDQNVVLPNGDVVLCCMDYSVKHKIGNLLDESYYHIFSGKRLAALHAENMSFGDRGISLCRTCDRARPLTLRRGAQFWTA